MPPNVESRPVSPDEEVGDEKGPFLAEAGRAEGSVQVSPAARELDQIEGAGDAGTGVGHGLLAEVLHGYAAFVWDIAVGALSLLTVLTLGPTLVVASLLRRGWQRVGPDDTLWYLGAAVQSGWASWRITAPVADWFNKQEVKLRLFAFIAAASAAGIQLVQSL